MKEQCHIQLRTGLQCGNWAKWVVSGKPICGKHADMIRSGRALIIEGCWVNGVTQPKAKVEVLAARGGPQLSIQFPVAGQAFRPKFGGNHVQQLSR